MLNRSYIFYKSLFFVFTLSVILKIFLSGFVLFGASAEILPVVAAIPSVWVFFCLIERFAKKRKILYYMVVNIVLTSIYFAVIMYYKYFGVIVTYRALQQVGQVTQVKGSVMHLMHPYFLLIYADIVLFMILYAYLPKMRLWGRQQTSNKTLMSAILALSLMISFINIWANRSIVNELKMAQHMGIVNYQIYTIATDLGRVSGKPIHVTPEEIRDLKKSATPLDHETANFQGIAKGRNVIVLQMEAFQDLLINKKVDGLEITPNMNKLAKENVYFDNFFQQAGQGNTSDAEYLLNTSFYVPPHGAASQTYVDKDLPSLPKLFKSEGYETVTFHTNDVMFWNRQKLYTSLGFDRYYDKKFFKDEDFLFFGASDPILYKKTSEEMARMQNEGISFYSNVISMSSHHPFDMPEDRRLIKLPERYENTFVGDYLVGQNYADHALGLFIDELKANGVWNNSLIVVYGDHMGLPVYSLTTHEKALLKEMLGRDYHYPDMMNIPLIIAAPGKLQAETYSQVGGQIDLMPTIANLMGLSLNDHIVFGQDILNHQFNLLPQRYYLPSGSFITNRNIFVSGKGYSDGINYPLPEGENNQETTKVEYTAALELLKLCDGYVSGLPEKVSK
ncbi:MAG: LTA synthase family protein [Gorillibacterium sp.]|nr:LTA synthase family protein [Gorillibacterium sp.]